VPVRTTTAVTLYASLKLLGRFGVGAIKVGWSQETHKVSRMVPMAVEGLAPGVQPPMVEQLVDEVVYQGNALQVVSPYRIFPDPRLPLTRFQDGEFCASEDDYSRNTLRQLEAAGEVVGVEFIPRFSDALLLEGNRRTSWMTDNVGLSLAVGGGKGDKSAEEFVIITEVQVELIPANWVLDDGKPLGPGKTPEKYLVWYANDARIVKFQPMGYLH